MAKRFYNRGSTGQKNGRVENMALNAVLECTEDIQIFQQNTDKELNYENFVRWLADMWGGDFGAVNVKPKEAAIMYMRETFIFQKFLASDSLYLHQFMVENGYLPGMYSANMRYMVETEPISKKLKEEIKAQDDYHDQMYLMLVHDEEIQCKFQRAKELKGGKLRGNDHVYVGVGH